MRTQRFKLLYVLMLFLPFIVSCEEEKVPDNTPDQLFRPAEILATVNGNNVVLSWTPIRGATYMLELSMDSLLFENIIQTFSVEGDDMLIVEELLGRTRYSTRVKAVSTDPQIKDSGWQPVTFETETENIFYAVLDENIAATSVTLSWIAGRAVSHIVASTSGAPDVVVQLSASDVIAGNKMITGLNASKSYVFAIYNDTRLRGTITVATKAS